MTEGHTYPGGSGRASRETRALGLDVKLAWESLRSPTEEDHRGGRGHVARMSEEKPIRVPGISQLLL